MWSALLLLAALAAPEPQFRPLPGIATCLRATGEPGSIAVLGPLGRRAAATDLLTAGGDLRARVTLGNLVGCAAVAADASGAAVVAGPVRRDRRIEVRAAVGGPGDALGPPSRLGGASERAREVVAAVSAGGDAVVAWAQVRGSWERERVRIVAARRLPGAPFGGLEPLTPWRRADSGALDANRLRLAAGADAAGALTVAWVRARPLSRDRFAVPVEAATAGPGSGFGTPQRIGHAQWFDPVPPALAVAPGGRALLAFAHPEGGIAVAERAPGAAFAPVGRFLGPAGSPAAAVRDDGAAVVAWRTSSSVEAGVAAATRSAGGAFGPAQTVAPDRPRTPSFSTDYAEWRPGPRPRPPADHANVRLRAALAPDGRALLGWTIARVAAHASYAAPMAASGTLTTGFGLPVALGSPARSVNGLAPLVLPDGTPALAFTDNVPTGDFLGGVPEFAAGGGRLHLVRPGAAAADPPAPRLRIRALPSTGRRVRIAVRCSAACDVRATVPTGAGVVGGGAAASLRRAGRRVVRLRGDPAEPIAWRRRSVRVHVLATAPAGARSRVVVRRVPLR